jgi:hypothetical protein
VEYGAAVGDGLGDIVGSTVGSLVGLPVGPSVGEVEGLPVGATLFVEGWTMGVGVQNPQSNGHIALARLSPSVEHWLSPIVLHRTLSSRSIQAVGLTVGCGVGFCVGGGMVGAPVGHTSHDTGQYFL